MYSYRGESPAEAEAGLLDTARKVETYGMKLCIARVSRLSERRVESELCVGFLKPQICDV